MTPAQDPPTVPLLCLPPDRDEQPPSPGRWPTRRALRVTWALFALAVLAFYAVPIGAAAGWW